MKNYFSEPEQVLDHMNKDKTEKRIKRLKKVAKYIEKKKEEILEGVEKPNKKKKNCNLIIILF